MEFLSLSRRRSPLETSPAAKSEDKRMFSQAIFIPKISRERSDEYEA